MSGSNGNSVLERRTVDYGLYSLAQNGASEEINTTVDGLLFGQISDDIPQPNVCPTEDLLATELPAMGNAHGYNLRTDPPANLSIDFEELFHRQAITKQHRLAATWTKICNDVQSEIVSLRTNIYTYWDPQSAQETASKLITHWKRLDEVHKEYLSGIKERKRLEFVETKYSAMKDLATNVLEEFKGQLQINQLAKNDDALENISVQSDCSHLSKALSSSTQRGKLRTMLLAKKKLELAKARQQEEVETAKLLKEMNARREIRKLEEEAALAEVEWQVETECNTNTDVHSIVDGDQGHIQHSTPIANPGKPSEVAPTCTSTVKLSTRAPTGSDFFAVPPASNSPTKSWSPGYDQTRNSVEQCVPSLYDQQNFAKPRVFSFDDERSSPKPRVSALDDKQSAKEQHIPPPTSVKGNSNSAVPDPKSTPMDHIAAMLKIQLLNGIKPTQFSGKPADFPFLRKQLSEHLESQFLSDAQRVEYLPKFLCGDALEVIKRNRGCLYDDLVNILENRYGRPIQVSQACIEELVSGPKLNYGDNVELLNFAERLNTATKILTGADEQEISVATNLRKIIDRLPNDLIPRWQNENYEILRRGSPARLKHISDFVKKHATIRNDPVYGSSKRENKDIKTNTRPTLKPHPSTRKLSTVANTSVEKGMSTAPVDRCDVCKGPRHNLKDCPIIKQCDHEDVRSQYAAAYRFCFNCGKQRPGHGSGTCPDTPSCRRCGGRHLDILHKDIVPSRQSSSTYSRDKGSTYYVKKPDSKPQPNGVSSAAVNNLNSSVVLNVLPVVITSMDNRSLSTYAFLDNGCTDTLIDQQLADELHIKGAPEEIQITTITSSQQAETQHVSFTLKSLEGDEEIKVSDAYVLPDLHQSEQVLPESVDTSYCPHLQDIKFSTVDVPRISILIGSNIPSAHVQREVRSPNDDENGLYGYRYPLGWTLCGPINAVNKHTASLNSISMDCHLDEAFERFWKIEDNTISGATKELSIEDKRALQIIEETTRFVDGHYEVGLPWKDVEPKLPNNRIMAEKRLEMLRRRLLKPGNKELESMYRQTMQGYIEKEYAKKLTKDESNTESQVRWYLPHHPVCNPNKPGKVRVVFDAAAEFNGTSLNKALLQGPDSTNSLIGVLLRFRKGNVALAADVESMFHQVRVPERDQQALRFLWWTHGYDNPPDVYAMRVHIFGATSSPCVVNSTLRRTADDNSDDFTDEAVAAVKRNFYVDDGLPSSSDAVSAASLANELVDLLHRGGFNLTKFTSNSKDVLAAIPSQKRAKPELDLDFDELPVERALGVRWHVESDELGFTIKDLDRPETKRGILSTVCSLYDPLGMAAPVVLQAKNLLQDLWRARVDWDEPLTDSFLTRWRGWKNALQTMADVRIPRCYFPPGTILSQCQLQMHHFADASEHGYGTVSYLRVKYPDGTIHCSFLMGKSRNAPVKFTTVPRLELQASVLSTRMNNSIRAKLDLDIEITRYWTDSAIVLHYLSNSKLRLQTFVANRVQEIKENSSVEEWSHVPGVLNPADDVSRWYAPQQLSPDGRWLRGPDFLWRDESCWPDGDINVPTEEVLELKKEKHVNTTAVKSQENSSTSNEMPTLHQVVEGCSNWTTLLRRIAWLARFVQYIRDRNNVPTGNLTLDEIENAELQVIKIAQQACYKDEIKFLSSAKGVSPSSKIANLNPMLDSRQLLRVNGRVTPGPTLRITTQPLIIPKDHHVAALLITHIHKSCGHLGREHVLSRLREKFWIPQARVLTRSILSRCLTCKRLSSKPLTQQMAPLPTSRSAAYEPPFTHTGMDLFGPLHVKHGRGTAKRWCCLFTCLTTRAVHLEVVNSLSTDDFLLCLRRFLNRRGDVLELRCDNGTNFVGAERESKESLKAWNQDQIQKELIQRGCRWIFQPPTASSMSGVWERLVRSAKTVLKAIIGTHTVCDVVLSTVLTEVERILNSRALTNNSDDPNDLDPLTPAHFLLQRKVC